MPTDPSLRPLPVEDIDRRDPEWELLPLDPGQGPSEGRVVSWDPIHGWLMKDGPKIVVGSGGRRRYTRPY